MKRYWVSFESGEEDYRPIYFPPKEGILGWWCSGFNDETSTIVVWIEAENANVARSFIKENWPEYQNVDNFFNEIELDWRPNNRFPISKWSKEYTNE